MISMLGIARRTIRWCGQIAVVVYGIAGSGMAATAAAQGGADRQLASGPAFLSPRPHQSGAVGTIWDDASDDPILKRRIALVLHDIPLEDALDTLGARSGLKISYSSGVIRTRMRVNLNAPDITVGGAFSALLYNASADVLLTPSGQVAIVRHGSARVPVGAIVGRVEDSATAQGIRGADVLLAGTAWHTVTDSAGQYRLDHVDAGRYTLTVRRIGYAQRQREVTVAEDATDTVNVSLSVLATRLDELVTTATGQRRRRDIANDVTTINADSVMKTAPIRSVTDLLATRVPGLTTQLTSGAPGDPSRLRLRGSGSPLRSNDPIVIVDGVRVYAEQSAARSANLTGSGYAAPSPIDYIDPNSIETIEVLKGPSAATLYGQDAANGVIVITTKRGKAGPTRWSASFEQGQTKIPGQFPDLYFRWGHLAQQSGTLRCTTSNAVYGGYADVPLRCVEDSTVRFQLLNDPTLTALGKGHRSSITLGASGGTATLTYALTGSFSNELGLPELPSYEVDRYQTQFGMAPPDWMQRPQDYKRWGLTSNLSARVGPTADVTLSSSFSRGRQQRSSLETELGTLMATYVDKASGTYYTTGIGINPTSPQSVTEGFLAGYYQRIVDVATAFTNSLNVNWRPRSWLTVKADAGLNVSHRDDEDLLPRGIVDTAGHLNVAQGTVVQSTLNLGGTALAPIGHGFAFRFSAGVNYAGTSTGDESLQTTNLPAGTTLQGSVIAGGSRSVQNDATFGWYVEPSIGNSKFNFSSGLRLDGGSSYGGNVNGFRLPSFPKLGFSYLVSDESWFPLKKQVQSLRLRLAYGRASRQPGIADRLRTYSDLTPVFADGTLDDGAYLQTLGNTDLRPERSTEIETGFDADLLDSRVTVAVSVYRKTTDDALLLKTLPPSLGGNANSSGQNLSVMTNIGRVRNTGLNLDVGAQLIRSGFVTWSAGVQLSQNRNIVVGLGQGVEPFYTSASPCSGCLAGAGGTRIAAGYPLFGRWSRPVVGYADVNGDGYLDGSGEFFLGEEEIFLGDTAVYVGAQEPNYTAGLHTTLSLWRGTVTLNASFFYQDGLSQVNTVSRSLAPFSRQQNDTTATLAEQAATASLGTDYNWIQTVNTFRFNDLALTYQVPAAVARRLGAQNLHVAIQGANLGLWTNYRGLDPNVNARVTGNDVMDTGVLPEPRTWQLRVDATF